jgi:hypothetical protein
MEREPVFGGYALDKAPARADDRGAGHAFGHGWLWKRFICNTTNPDIATAAGWRWRIGRGRR